MNPAKSSGSDSTEATTVGAGSDYAGPDACQICFGTREIVVKTTVGANIELTANLLDCNAIDLNGEPFFEQPVSIVDLGENWCGCDGLAP